MRHFKEYGAKVKSITDLPNEVIEKYIMIYLSSNDVCSFGMTGINRFKIITESVLQKRGTLAIRRMQQGFTSSNKTSSLNLLMYDIKLLMY